MRTKDKRQAAVWHHDVDRQHEYHAILYLLGDCKGRGGDLTFEVVAAKPAPERGRGTVVPLPVRITEGTDIQAMRAAFVGWCEAQAGIRWKDSICVQFDDRDWLRRDKDPNKMEASLSVEVQRVLVGQAGGRTWHKEPGSQWACAEKPRGKIIPYTPESWAALVGLVERVDELTVRLQKLTEGGALLEALARISTPLLPAFPETQRKEENERI